MQLKGKQMGFRGDRLKTLREQRGLTQSQLANLIQGKQQQIAEYENKNRYPRTDSLVKLVKALGCSSDYLLDLSEKPSEQVSTLSSNLALILSTLSQKEQDRIERMLKAMLSDDG